MTQRRIEGGNAERHRLEKKQEMGKGKRCKEGSEILCNSLMRYTKEKGRLNRSSKQLFRFEDYAGTFFFGTRLHGWGLLGA